jgi:hypothetical protein
MYHLNSDQLLVLLKS